MSKPKDGGPAFPNVPSSAGVSYANWDMGMSLRDYFAAKALQGMIATGGKIAETDTWQVFCSSVDFNISDACELSYFIADAMLAEREKERE